MASGRWHSKGKRIVYLAEHPASALLEVLVHLEVDTDDLPTSYRLHAVEIDDDSARDSVNERNLPHNWRDNLNTTRSVGDEWIAKNKTLLLKVPSAIVPFASNWLLNPSHVDSPKARVTDSYNVPYDTRLLR